jgi:hypothetical protein
MKIGVLIIGVLFMTLVGCVSKTKTEEPKVVSTTASEVLNKDFTFFTFDAVCLNPHAKEKLYPVLDFTVESVTPDIIGINQSGVRDFLTTSCILEAKEKIREVSYSTEVVSFECFLDDNIVIGNEYNFVAQLSSTMVWLVSLKDGQNIVIPKNLCLFSRLEKK